MKSIYFWIVAALFGLGILPAAADNVQFTVNVPNPDAISLQVNNQPYELVKGANEFDVPEYTNFFFQGVSPYKLSGVTNKAGSAVSGFYGDTWYFYPNAEHQDEVFTLEVINLDEFRTASLTINVDDPDLVNVMVGGYYTNLTLEKGENTVKFDPAVETYLSITPKTSAPIYKVELNGTPVAAQGTSYTVSDLEDGWVIDITATLPDEDRTVSFSYSENGLGALAVSVNGVDVEDFDNETLVVKLGSTVTLNSKVDYKYNSVTVNGKELGYIDWQGVFSFTTSSFTVMEDSEVYVDAAPYGKIKATVIVTDPRFVTLYKGRSYENNVIPLQEGENEIELIENNSLVSWEISGEAILNSVKYNDETLSSYTTEKTLAAGSTLVFDVTEKVFDLTAVVWIDNTKGQYCSAAADGSGFGYFNFNSPAERNLNIELNNGYNFVSFYEGMNPFAVSWYSSNPDYLNGKLYLNDELLEPLYEGSTSYSIDLAEDDVLKIFMDAQPEECAVEFEINDNIEPTVVKDIVTEVEDPSAGFTCFAGTKVTISGSDLKVALNGEDLAADENDTEVDLLSDDDTATYSFVVTDSEVKVAISSASQSAISSIETSVKDSEVYNMLGVKVGSKSDLRSLAPGVYIVNGKKTVVK